MKAITLHTLTLIGLCILPTTVNAAGNGSSPSVPLPDLIKCSKGSAMVQKIDKSPSDNHIQIFEIDAFPHDNKESFQMHIISPKGLLVFFDDKESQDNIFTGRSDHTFMLKFRRKGEINDTVIKINFFTSDDPTCSYSARVTFG